MYLHFDDLYVAAGSVPISLDPLAPAASDVSVLEGLRELAARRNQSVCREGFALGEVDVAEHVERFEAYLSLLDQFIKKAKEERWGLTLPSGGFEWTSPLAAAPHTANVPLPTVALDQVMALCFYAAALQEHAWSLLQAASDSDGAHVAAAAALRRAAGVHAFLADHLLPTTSTDIAATGAPMELRIPAAQALQEVALAAAQAVAAHRAEAKGASPAALGAVHRGAVDLFESAAAKIRVLGAAPAPSERLRQWLALSAELHATKAGRAQAAALRAVGELGMACACLHVAIARVQRCLAVAGAAPGGVEWAPPLRDEMQALEAALAAADKERVGVYMQTVPPTAPPLPQGKVIVAPAPFDLPPATERFFL